MSLSILVAGAENPRIRDLFNQVNRYVEVSYLCSEAMGRKPDLKALKASWHWHKQSGEPPIAKLLLPHRWDAVTHSLTKMFCEATFLKRGKPDVIVYTWPQLAYLAEAYPEVTRVYYCKDPFEQWTWGPEKIRPLETRLLNNVDAVFAVSKLLAQDFIPRTSANVHYLPNGFEDSFVSPARLPRPANLPADMPVIGSVGQINATYDWDYIRELTTSLPDVRFVFVGNVDEGNPYKRKEIMQQLTTTPNIVWLGRQPHDQVPAYLQNFDISFCFLRPDDFGNRRSPLRLYDFLTADQPILSTPVTEAYEHLPHIEIASSVQDAVRLVREILAGQHPVDKAARHAYIQEHTWSVRARQFLEGLLEVLPKDARSAELRERLMKTQPGKPHLPINPEPSLPMNESTHLLGATA